MVPLFEPSKKVVPLFERGKRWCHYLIITLKVVPLYDVYPINYIVNYLMHQIVVHVKFMISLPSFLSIEDWEKDELSM